jgi:8-oxo-dGTP diphosphatase
MRDETDSAAQPEFGHAEPGAAYKDRPVAYGIAPRADGLIATVRIARDAGPIWDLPGGMLDPGENEPAALVREFMEETGWLVAPREVVARARQYTVTSTGERRHNIAAFYLCDLVGDRDAKEEDDHELVWLDPVEALVRMRHAAAAWAIAAWLRSDGTILPDAAGAGRD